ncbi:hypothetical protein AAW31_17945 [Nitrosomonas communis]|uniref:Uncharacterized protein n=1 Tax=Nitrosomonas communis TaxID=44574 RepID=A0A0F7KJJ4_9PROT|nr:hypothetical protein AAW31_17945 [Nitrosomonas communis]
MYSSCRRQPGEIFVLIARQHKANITRIYTQKIPAWCYAIYRHGWVVRLTVINILCVVMMLMFMVMVMMFMVMVMVMVMMLGMMVMIASSGFNHRGRY